MKSQTEEKKYVPEMPAREIEELRNSAKAASRAVIADNIARMKKTSANRPAEMQYFDEMADIFGKREKELQAAKQNIINGFPLRIDSNKKILDYLSVIGFYQLPLTYLDDFSARVNKVTVAEISAAFKRKINPELLATVIVGAPGETDKAEGAPK